MAEIITLRVEPSLQDIPGMLRHTADRIEKGELGDIETAFLIIPEPGNTPIVFGWGNIDGNNSPIIQLELAKMAMLTNLLDDED